MHITALVLELGLPGCRSLKEKRGRLAPILNGLRREFGLSAAEVARLEDWDLSTIACALVSTSATHNDSVLRHAVVWIEAHPKNILVHSAQVEQR